MRRKTTLWIAAVSVAVVALVATWNILFSTTHIAFVNHQATTLGQIAKSNNNDRIKLSVVGVEELDNLSRYDAVLVNGMGLRITEEQRASLQEAADNGVCVITTMATNPANNIVSVDSATYEVIKGYLSGGGRGNYRNMLTYIRRNIDGKSHDTQEPERPVRREQKQFYHTDPSALDEESREFDTLAEYEAFLKQNNLFKLRAPHVIITGYMGDPEELVHALEKSGNVVYPVRDMKRLIESHQADSIQPNVIINLAHGRMGDYIEKYLAKTNIPLFAPLNVNTLVSEWEHDKMGMNGGFMSQSVVMPEIDGAIRPYALFAHRLDDDGFRQSFAIPERLETFVRTINNHIALQNKPNSEKRVAIYYYKGPGQNALTAAGMEVAPSLYNLLQRMKSEGYKVENMPASVDELNALIQRQGAVYNAYANGAKADFLQDGNPELIIAQEYAQWTTEAIRPQMMADVTALDGEFPGSYIATSDGRLALPRVELGNVVLIPQLAAGAGDDDFAIVHGTDAAPPHAYIASYLWTRYDFKADVMIHFGTHGSLEFTPKKQVALCNNDWPDALVGATPHLYIYSIADVGEGVIAKRRAYATLQSHLTPPFMESNVRGLYKELCAAIEHYNSLLYAEEKPNTDNAALQVKRLAVKAGIHRELRLDSVLGVLYDEEEIARIEAFAEELINEKVTGELYTMGVPYSAERVRSSVIAMSTEPVAYSLLALDKSRGKVSSDIEKHKTLFTRRYLNPARDLVNRLYDGTLTGDEATICSVAAITLNELRRVEEIDSALNTPQDMMSRMMAMMSAANNGAHPSTTNNYQGGHPSWIPKIGKRPKHTSTEHSVTDKQPVMKGVMSLPDANDKYTKEEKEFARVVMELKRTIGNVSNYINALKSSPEAELVSLLNAMNGGYTSPSSGGDPIANPNSIPTGRNLFAINAEATPSETAWERGKALADNTIRMYRERHNDSIPRKVSYTLWSGEFVETEGATIAQVLYMLGVEPIHDTFGRVSDIRLIPSEQLGRPRIDVVVQTSGQLRDMAASRLFLISRAVEMAAASTDDVYPNYVSQGVVDAERTLIERGVSPKQAREMSARRVFGGLNGSYGTGITNMIQSGNRWENVSEIADVYLHNMSAYYGSESAWEQTQQFVLEVALINADAVVQPRQSNTWGALSLDHVYEFMGGMNLAIRSVTGKDPDAYMSDYRNRNNMRMQELKEAIGVESRTTIFNPTYIKEKLNGGQNAAGSFAEIIQNTYGWNVTKPDVIDDEMWDEVYEVYVKDKFGLNVRERFEQHNPAALEEITAVMMETARKGLWKATSEQLSEIATLHVELIEKHKPSCSNTVCNNGKLLDFIASNITAETAQIYKENIRAIHEMSPSDDKGMVLKRETLNATDKVTTYVNNGIIGALVAVAILVLVFVVRCRRKRMEK